MWECVDSERLVNKESWWKSERTLASLGFLDVSSVNKLDVPYSLRLLQYCIISYRTVFHCCMNKNIIILPINEIWK